MPVTRWAIPTIAWSHEFPMQFRRADRRTVTSARVHPPANAPTPRASPNHSGRDSNDRPASSSVTCEQTIVRGRVGQSKHQVRGTADRHAVLSQRAGLVFAQSCSATERFDHTAPPCQHLGASPDARRRWQERLPAPAETPPAPAILPARSDRSIADGAMRSRCPIQTKIADQARPAPATEPRLAARPLVAASSIVLSSPPTRAAEDRHSASRG